MGKQRQQPLEKVALRVCAKGDLYEEKAEALAKRLNVEFVKRQEETQGLWLCFGEEGLSLTDGRLTLQGDFFSLLPRAKVHNLRQELLVKAARLKGVENPLVLDATAGLGEDSFLLAAAGCRVRLFESDPVIAALLRDALDRSSKDPELRSIVQNMELFEEDSIRTMREEKQTPDIVYLDPMFPERQKSGLIKKKFQLLQQLERPCGEEEPLLEAAIMAKPRKIIVKRPLKGPYLAERKPDYSLSGKAIRYDCYLLEHSLSNR